MICPRLPVCFGTVYFGLLGCSSVDAAEFVTPASGQPAGGTLEISFLFNKAEGVVPSYQIAIWLESEEGKFVKTLFVRPFLAGVATEMEYICPDWVKQANWEEVTEAEFDAVTRPTPPIGSNTLTFDCQSKGIPPGTYRFCMQAHINANYNILYRGNIAVGRDVRKV